VKLLAFDTATDVCTVAVWIDGDVYEREERGQRHAERILVLVDEVLAEAGTRLSTMDAIAFGRGPGSFTGLRISAGVAQGLAFGADLPVVPVSSLAAQAQGIDATHVLAAFDARVQQVYWGAYVRNSDGLMTPQTEEAVVAPSGVPLPPPGPWVGAGSGWDQYAGVLLSRLGSSVANWQSGCQPRARFVAELAAADYKAGKVRTAEEALPVYIRDDVAAKSVRTVR
jgi:tRNA threonylcarbamoyladenosine biosynthesis protein TsaB